MKILVRGIEKIMKSIAFVVNIPIYITLLSKITDFFNFKINHCPEGFLDLNQYLEEDFNF